MPATGNGSPGDVTYSIETGPGVVEAGARNTIGGWPVLPDAVPWPVCHCGERMVLFLQIDVPPDIPSFGSDHLLVFQCPAHNDACFATSEQLPPRFFDGTFWRILLHRSGAPAADPDPYLQPRNLVLHRRTDGIDADGRGIAGFKVSGTPSWAQAPERYTCQCGTELAFVCQIPVDHGFEALPGQPERPDGFSSTEYGLFLGNEVYVLACPANCYPAAAWPVNQN